MRFIVLHKVDEVMEAGAPPNKDIVKNMGALVQGSVKAGTFENGAGLHRSATRVKVDFAGGERKVTKGPLTGTNELVGRIAMIRAQSMEDAIDYAGRFAKVLGDGEIEIGPVVEPWDLKMMPKPEGNQPGRFLLLFKSDADRERGVPLKPETKKALDALLNELRGQEVLLAAESIAPSKKGARAPAATGKRTWIDGPFAESKELIAGFSILNLPSKAEALAWADRYAAILEGSEVDVLELSDS